MKFSRGFTLIELLVVISVIALLSSVVLASLNSARDKAKKAAGMRFDSSAYHSIGHEVIGMWNFEEGSGSLVTDTSNNGNNGTVSGASFTTNTYTSSSGYALQFDGTDSVRIPHNSNQLLTNGFTITAWINPVSAATYARIVDKTTDINASNGFAFYLPANYLGVIVNTGTQKFSPAGSISFDGTWKHVAVSVSPSAVANIYINGAQSGTPVTVSPLSGITTTNDLCIGNRSGTGACSTDRTFNGGIDDVRIYASQLSASEINKLYAESAPKYMATSAR